MTAACSIGGILLQPERVSRFAAADGEEALIEDLLSAVARVVADRAAGGTIADDFVAALEAVGPKVLQRAGSGMYTAVERIRDAVRPLESMVEKIVALLDDDDPSAVADGLLALLATLAETTEAVSIERMREHTILFLNILEEDLGLTASALEEEFWSLTDDLIVRLEVTDPGLDPSLKANRRAVGGTLRRIRRRARGVITFPALNADRIAQLLFEQLNKLVGPHLKQAACLGHVTSDTLAAVKALKDAVPFTGLGTGTLGAAVPAPETPEREFRWYASWLLGDADVAAYELWRIPFPADVWVDHSGASPQVMYRDKPLTLRGHPDKQACQDAPDSWRGLTIPGVEKRDYTFRKVDPDVMERIAFHSSWIVDATEALLHIWSPLSGGVDRGSLTIRKGGQPSAIDILDLLIAASNATVKVATDMPVSFHVGPGDGGRWASASRTLVSHLLASLQGAHWNGSTLQNFKMWAVLCVIGDTFRWATPALTPATLRDAVLSYITLYNFQDLSGEGSQYGSDNRLHPDGLLSVIELASNLTMIKVAVDAKYYGHPVSGNSKHIDDFWRTYWLQYLLLYGTLFGLLTGVVGTLLSWGIAGVNTLDPLVLGKKIGKSVAKSVVLFILNLFLWKEGSIDGKLNLEGGKPFNGYPKVAESPYLLPWAAGDTWACGQGNLGMFSHNFTNPKPQVYAYDFMLDQGTEILAARAGTVVDYFDWVPNGTKDSTPAPITPDVNPGQSQSEYWNFIAIRHDANDQPADPKKTHDAGPGGDLVTTYAIYGHGLQNGVRDVFKNRPNPVNPLGIIGTKVKQGEPIMLADSTGISLCNHVHMEVRVGPPASTALPITRDKFKVTIPFVFNDGGQPDSMEWCVSSNERKPPKPPAPAPADAGSA